MNVEEPTTLQRAAALEETIARKYQQIKNHHWRDKFHYIPKAGWINDPCGVIQFKGKYHLFVQHHPFSGKWGQMHWGHAISDDMIHWRYLPEALVPGEPYDDWSGGGIFTGSAIEHHGKMYLFYTACAAAQQTQCLAISEDGCTFKKFAGNPVLASAPTGMNPRDFRDPKVWQHGDYWYMVTGTTAGKSVLEHASNYETNGFGKVALHRSQNLIDWEFVNYPLESMGELGTMLECPNLFALDGKFVLMYSPKGLQQRQVIYLVGDFDYRSGKFYWHTMGAVDWGFDYYAPQFFVDDTGRTIIYGWAGSWPFMPWSNGDCDSAKLGWAGSITIPRTVKLCSDGKLAFAPITEVKQLRQNCRIEYDVKIANSDSYPVQVSNGNQCEILVCFDLTRTDADKIIIALKSNGPIRTLLIFDLRYGNLIFDRTASGSISAFSRCCPLESASSDVLEVRILIDSVTVEVFTDSGRTVMTNHVYSPQDCCQLAIYNENGSSVINNIATFDLKSIAMEDYR